MVLTKDALSPADANVAPAKAPTVLVVDDEPGIVDSLQKILERESLRVLGAGSGGEALDLIRREPVSVLITDLMMPGMSGIDLLKASRSVSPETETVLMTAYGTVENAAAIHGRIIGPIASLMDAIQHDGTPITDVADNLGTLRVVHAAYHSAQQHRSIRPEELKVKS